MTIVPLTPIAEAVRAVRARYLPDVAAWASDILSGNPAALTVGEELLQAVNSLHVELEQLGGSFDSGVVERLVGVEPVVDAVLVAIGEQPSDDPEVNERFRPARLAAHKAMAEKLLESHRGDPDAVGLVEQCRADLALIDAGIEPE